MVLCAPATPNASISTPPPVLLFSSCGSTLDDFAPSKPFVWFCAWVHAPRFLVPATTQHTRSDGGDRGEGDHQVGRGDHQAAAGQAWSRGFLRRANDSVEEEESKEDGSSSGARRRREQQQQLRRRFFVGQWLDVKDTVNNWLEATVMDMTSCGECFTITEARLMIFLGADSPVLLCCTQPCKYF